MRFRKPFLALSLCLAMSLPLAACDNPQQKEARYIKRGNELFQKGEPEKARVEYKNAARLQPTAAEPRYRLGILDEEEGDLRNAFGNFTAAEQQDPHFHPAVLKVAQYFMAGEHYEETRKRLDAVLAESPDDAEAHALFAALLLRQKDFDRAEKEGRVALAKDPDNISAYSALTGLYSVKEDLPKAIETVNEGISRNPQNLALPMLRVLLYERTGDLSKIAESYQAIFKLRPDDGRYRVDLASIYTKAGKIDEAEAALRAGVAALPKDWEMKHQLVVFLAEQRGMDAAENETKSLMQANPKNDEPYFWLADLYASHDATDKAVALLQEIVARGESDGPALNARALLARIDIKRGNRDLAEKLVTTILTKAPDNRDALLIRASLEYDKGYYQSAVSDLRTIVRTEPKDQDALQMLSETLLLQGHLDLAIDTMQKLVELNPANLAARVRLAQIVNLNGDPRRAIDIISLVTKADPNYPVGWETAARIAISAKDWLPAETAIRQLDKIDGQHLTAAFLEGQVLDANGKSEEAIAKYTEIINADPTTPLAEHALTSLVESYHRLDRMQAAAAYLETVRSDSPTVATMLGKSYAATGKLTEAATAFDRAIDAHTTTQDAYLDRARLYLNAHQPEQAIDILKKGAAAIPSDFRAPMMEADLLSSAGRTQEAIGLYEDLLARNPELNVAANNLAEVIADYAYTDGAALEKAQQTAERFSGSTNPLLLDTLAWVYYRQGNIALAETTMERGLAQGTPVPPQVHYHYGAILLQSGKKEQARAELQKAVAGPGAYPGVEDARKMLSSL